MNSLPFKQLAKLNDSERPGSKYLLIDVPFVANIRLTPLWLPR